MKSKANQHLEMVPFWEFLGRKIDTNIFKHRDIAMMIHTLAYFLPKKVHSLHLVLCEN